MLGDHTGASAQKTTRRCARAHRLGGPSTLEGTPVDFSRGVDLLVHEAVFVPPPSDVEEFGVLVLTAGPDVMRLLPPLNISEEELEKGLDRIGKALKKLHKVELSSSKLK